MNDVKLRHCLALRSIPIEFAMTDVAKEATAHVRTFSHPIRLMMDNGIRGNHTIHPLSMLLYQIADTLLLILVAVVIGTFDYFRMRKTRSQAIFKLIQRGNLDVVELLTLLSFGYRQNTFIFNMTLNCKSRRNFQPYHVREKLYREFWDKAINVLRKLGFNNFAEIHYTPTESLASAES